ncbi:flagellar type III secretion system pore protein FliP [candidate division KSB1 bacterium]
MENGVLKRKRLIFISLIVIVLLISGNLNAQTVPTITKITLGIDQAKEPGDVAITLQILLLMTILTLAPAILILMTSFTRIIIVFHFIRQALGTHQMPSNQILVGLALFLTFFVLSPTIKKINDTALQPYLKEEISDKDAMSIAQQPIKEFMLKLTGEKEMALFVQLANLNRPNNPDELPLHVIVPAFVISELRIAFQIGFLIYIPFLMIDMIVASILMSMGMLMLPPIMISLPFKILLFVLVDGWFLIVKSIMTSFTT